MRRSDEDGPPPGRPNAGDPLRPPRSGADGPPSGPRDGGRAPARSRRDLSGAPAVGRRGCPAGRRRDVRSSARVVDGRLGSPGGCADPHCRREAAATSRHARSRPADACPDARRRHGKHPGGTSRHRCGVAGRVPRAGRLHAGPAPDPVRRPTHLTPRLRCRAPNRSPEVVRSIGRDAQTRSRRLAASVPHRVGRGRRFRARIHAPSVVGDHRPVPAQTHGRNRLGRGRRGGCSVRRGPLLPARDARLPHRRSGGLAAVDRRNGPCQSPDNPARPPPRRANPSPARASRRVPRAQGSAPTAPVFPEASPHPTPTHGHPRHSGRSPASPRGLVGAENPTVCVLHQPTSRPGLPARTAERRTGLACLPAVRKAVPAWRTAAPAAQPRPDPRHHADVPPAATYAPATGCHKRPAGDAPHTGLPPARPRPTDWRPGRCPTYGPSSRHRRPANDLLYSSPRHPSRRPPVRRVPAFTPGCAFDTPECHRHHPDPSAPHPPIPTARPAVRRVPVLTPGCSTSVHSENTPRLISKDHPGGV